MHYYGNVKSGVTLGNKHICKWKPGIYVTFESSYKLSDTPNNGV